MYVGRDYSPQENDESEVLGLDFVNDLDHNETVTQSKWSCTVSAGEDPDAALHLQGPSLPIVPLDGTLKTATIQRIGSLKAGVTYVVRAEVITSLGNVRSLWSHIRGVAAVT